MSKEERSNNTTNIIIETPRGCRNKYAYDEELKGFKLTKIMPAGAVFPFDFGFIPGTKGEDGDPLDVLVIMDEAAYPGCIIECRIIGALKAKQTEKDAVEQNNRLIGVSVISHTYNDIHKIDDLNKSVQNEIEHFFVSYNAQAGKKFMPEGWADVEEVNSMIEKSRVK